MAYTKTVSTAVDIHMFSIGEDNTSVVDYKGHLKNVKLKEEVSEVRSDGICDAWEDIEVGKGKWSVDLANKATAAGIVLRPGDHMLVQILSGIYSGTPPAETYPLTREGEVTVMSREDDLGSDSEAQSTALTLKGCGELRDVVVLPES